MFGLFQTIPSITTTALEAELTKNFTILDVRNPSEYRSGHIAKAINVPLNKISGYKGAKETPIYLICQSGMRSKKAAKILQKKGYSVVNIRGGMSQWTGQIRGGK